MTEQFSIDRVDGGAIFTIDRPAKLNALTRPVLNGLKDCLDELEASKTRFLVVTGQGDRAFCAGTDLGEMQGMTIDAQLEKSAMARSLLVRLSLSSLISVAAINGLALGGGLELAMACTLRIASTGATFGLPEVKLGLLPAYAGTQFLPTLVGRGRAQDLMLTGRTIDLEEAISIGLVNRRAPHGSRLVDEACRLAQEVVRHSPAAVTAIRECIDAAGTVVSDAGLAVEDRHVREVFAGEDAVVGVAAFLARHNN